MVGSRRKSIIMSHVSLVFGKQIMILEWNPKYSSESTTSKDPGGSVPNAMRGELLSSLRDKDGERQEGENNEQS